MKEPDIVELATEAFTAYSDSFGKSLIDEMITTIKILRTALAEQSRRLGEQTDYSYTLLTENEALKAEKDGLRFQLDGRTAHLEVTQARVAELEALLRDALEDANGHISVEVQEAIRVGVSHD